MNRKTIILALALGFVITGCKGSDLPESKVSEETIAKALDGKVDLEKEKEQEEKEKEAPKDEKANESNFEITGKNLKKLMVNIGEFDPSLARKLDNDELIELYKKCEEMSERTGYWDVKDFFFQELAGKYPDKSLKFPLKSIETKYYWKVQQFGTTTKI